MLLPVKSSTIDFFGFVFSVLLLGVEKQPEKQFDVYGATRPCQGRYCAVEIFEPVSDPVRKYDRLPLTTTPFL